MRENMVVFLMCKKCTLDISCLCDQIDRSVILKKPLDITWRKWLGDALSLFIIPWHTTEIDMVKTVLLDSTDLLWRHEMYIMSTIQRRVIIFSCACICSCMLTMSLRSFFLKICLFGVSIWCWIFVFCPCKMWLG